MIVFTLTIRLGNDAMQTGDDIARAVRAVAKKVHDSIGPTIMPDHTEGTIHDSHGASVGAWRTTTQVERG